MGTSTTYFDLYLPAGGEFVVVSRDIDDNFTKIDTALHAGRIRSNHTGTQLATTISDLTEAVQDIIGAFLADTTELDFTYNDAGDLETITFKAGSIAIAKLATNPLARVNHTGTQLAATISDFDASVRTSLPLNIRSVSADVTAAHNDVLLVDCTSASRAITLPASTAGRIVRVKKTDVSVNTVTVSPTSGTIDGASTKVLTMQFQSETFIADGTGWGLH